MNVYDKFELSNSNEIYIDETREQKLKGFGECYCENGDIEHGIFINGKLDGEGVRYICDENLKQSGIFSNGVFRKGIEFEKIGENYVKVFEGEFENGQKKKGEQFFSFGIVSFEGEYENGQKKRGKTFGVNGNLLFEGEYENGQKKSGKLFLPFEGLTFEGEFENGQKKKGKSFLSNGKISRQGVFENDQLKTGTYYTYRPDGTVFTENEIINFEKISLKQFRSDTTLKYNGKPDFSYGSLYNTKGNLLYIGYLKMFRKKTDIKAFIHYHGNGTLFHNDTLVIRFEGKFKNNIYDGKGKEYNIDGRLYQEGTFKKGFLHGKGIRYQENGIDILCKGKFIGGRFFDQNLFSIRKFLETNDDSVLKNVTKQSILSYIQNSYHDDSISSKSTKSSIVSMLQHLYKKHELNKQKTVPQKARFSAQFLNKN